METCLPVFITCTEQQGILWHNHASEAGAAVAQHASHAPSSKLLFTALFQILKLCGERLSRKGHLFADRQAFWWEAGANQEYELPRIEALMCLHSSLNSVSATNIIIMIIPMNWSNLNLILSLTVCKCIRLLLVVMCDSAMATNETEKIGFEFGLS